jgi:signal transduction histidine kinase
LLNLRFRVIAAIVLACGCALANAQPEPTLQVLIINSYDESTAPYFTVKNAFVSTLKEQYGKPVAFRQFDLGQRIGSAEGYDALKMQVLKMAYDDSPPDIVVAIGPPAVSFWLHERGAEFMDIPFIAAAADFAMTPLRFLPGDAVVATRFSYLETFDDFLKIKPGTAHVLMVFGSSNFEGKLAAMARQQLEGLSSRIDFEYTNQMKLAEIRERLASLPPDSAVFFGIFDRDKDGIALDNYSGLTLVRAGSHVPVFGVFDDQMGRGILGGRLIQLEEIGQEIAATAQTVMRERPAAVSWKIIDVGKPTYDWRELQAWAIDPALLPADSEILFKPATLWQQYSWQLLLVGVVFTAQVILIVALLLNRRRRRRAEVLSVHLGRRLISAQEDERRLLARELHDDLSQRLARLAIDSAYIAANPDAEDARDVLKTLQPELVSVSKDVHDMSYRLHPSLLDDLGLVLALQTECERVRRYADVNIIEHYPDGGMKIPPAPALCVYRIAQEALHNAVKYAQAEKIEVSVGREGPDGSSISLTVSDNGIGFEPAGDSVNWGLGLLSMRERAQLAGGSWEIRSKPGKGTTVRARVPIEGVRV